MKLASILMFKHRTNLITGIASTSYGLNGKAQKSSEVLTDLGISRILQKE
jgi:hypothetical protein